MTPACRTADSWFIRTVVGFTMALFISGLAFHDTHIEREAQLAILIGSLLAAAAGIAILLTSKATQAPGPK
jgi:NhaA family Na+:H+ antiporter